MQDGAACGLKIHHIKINIFEFRGSGQGLLYERNRSGSGFSKS
ncbi:hypothetical protein [Paenibacillus solani]